MKIQIKGISGGKDRRGLVSLVYRFLFTESTEGDALLGALPNRPTSLPEVGRKIVEWDVNNFGFLVDVTFEGIVSEPGKNEDQHSIRGEWREERIEAFPFRELLVRDYDAYEEEGSLKFPQYLTGGKSGSGGFKSAAKGKAETNPLFGTTSYPVMRLVATQTMVRGTVPSAVYRDVGKVVKSLPGGFKNPPKRTWIVDPPQTRSRGNAEEIVRTWKEVDDLKHLQALQLILQKGRPR